MQSKITTQLKRLGGFKSKKYLLAVSGGVDSMVLISVFQNLGLNIGIAHCNFQLRETEANLDMELVEKTAENLKVPFFKAYFDTKKYAKENKISTQMAARDLRYAWFQEIVNKHQYDFIVTGHHLNDQVETVLLNLVRGTGIEGLTGIEFLNKNIIRPLLSVSKENILGYAKEKNIEYREDKSNASNKYKRNSIRNQVIPLLEELNPSFLETMESNISVFKSVSEEYSKSIEKKLSNNLIITKEDKYFIHILELKKQINPSNLLFEFIKRYGFNFSDATQAITSLSNDNSIGKEFYSQSHVLLIDREELILYPKTTTKNIVKYIENDLKHVTFPLNLTFNKQKKKEIEIVADSNLAFFDNNTLQFPLKIRKWKAGDYFFPFGLKGRKNVSDFFIDNKFSKIQKQETYVLLSGNEIIWVIGHRSSEKHKVTTKTIDVLEIKLQESHAKLYRKNYRKRRD